MHHREFHFEGMNGISLYSRSWLPEVPPRAVIALVHPFGDGNGRAARVFANIILLLNQLPPAILDFAEARVIDGEETFSERLKRLKRIFYRGIQRASGSFTLGLPGQGGRIDRGFRGHQRGHRFHGRCGADRDLRRDLFPGHRVEPHRGRAMAIDRHGSAGRIHGGPDRQTIPAQDHHEGGAEADRSAVAGDRLCAGVGDHLT